MKQRIISGIRNNTRRGVVYISLVLTGIYTTIFISFFDFVLDDTFIFLRYSKNLANGHGLVWNIGSNPVQGYTSLLWVVVGAVPHYFGLPPVVFIKLISYISGLGAVIITITYLHKNEISNIFLLVAGSQLALSPVYIFNAVQGMESIFAGILTLVSSIGIMELYRNYRVDLAAGTCIFILLSILTRPELTVFFGSCLLALIYVLYNEGRLKDIEKLSSVFALVVIIPGLIYLVFNRLYFGYILPNPFEAKATKDIEFLIFDLGGISLTYTFILTIIVPYLLFVLFTILDNNVNNRTINRLAPILIGFIIFTSIWVFVNPEQAFHFRYQIPVFPTFILTTTLLIINAQNTITNMHGGDIKNNIIRAMIILLIVMYPLHSGPDVIDTVNNKDSNTRVEIGKTLAQIDDKETRIFLTESGAVPYYSELHSIDALGLNNRSIATNSKKGPSTEILREYEPDIILVNVGAGGSVYKGHPTIGSYINNNSYDLVAAVGGHSIFVNTESENYRDIVCSTSELNNETRGNVSRIVDLYDVDVGSVSIPSTQNGC